MTAASDPARDGMGSTQWFRREPGDTNATYFARIRAARGPLTGEEIVSLRAVFSCASNSAAPPRPAAPPETRTAPPAEDAAA